MLVVGRLRRAGDDLQPHRGGPREGDGVDARMADEGLSDVALARQQRERVGRHAGLAQRADQLVGATWRLLGRLEDDRVARGEGSRGHARRDRDREVPGRDDGGHATRPVRELVVLARYLHERSAGLERHGAARVVLEEVDRLADVAVRLGPRLRALAHLERREQPAARAHQAGGLREDRRALAGRARAPGREGRGGGSDRGAGVRGRRAGGDRDHPIRRPRVGGHELVALPAVLADPHGGPQRQHGVEFLAAPTRAWRARRTGAARGSAR